MVATPADNERGPRYMEKALAALHQATRSRDEIVFEYRSRDELAEHLFETQPLSVLQTHAQGFQWVMGSEAPLPARSFFSEIAASRFVHSMILDEVIVHLLVAASSVRTTIERFHRESELSLEAAGQTLVPDYQLSLSHAGKWFHFLFEVDNSTESLNSFAEQSIKNKLLGYDTYQDGVLSGWSQAGRPGVRPAFRVVFFTKTVERAEHILSLAHDLSRNRDRRLFVAVTQDSFLAEPDALRQPILLDHFGNWLPIVNPHDTTRSNKPPIRLRQAVAPSIGV